MWYPSWLLVTLCTSPFEGSAVLEQLWLDILEMIPLMTYMGDSLNHTRSTGSKSVVLTSEPQICSCILRKLSLIPEHVLVFIFTVKGCWDSRCDATEEAEDCWISISLAGSEVRWQRRCRRGKHQPRHSYRSVIGVSACRSSCSDRLFPRHSWTLRQAFWYVPHITINTT